MRQILFLMLFSIPFLSGYAYEERNLLENQADVARLKEILIPHQKWVPYPKYTDRAGWDSLTNDQKQMLIRRGEKYLNYEKECYSVDFQSSGGHYIHSVPAGRLPEGGSSVSHSQCGRGD